MQGHIKNHFKIVDPMLYRFVEKAGNIAIMKSQDYFSDLCEAIVSQQLSEKAGATIWGRFKTFVGSVTPGRVLAQTDEALRAVGMSWSKVAYVKNIARAVAEKQLLLAALDALPNEGVIKELTKIKGVGPWTAEMFLMFSLGREDVFSYGDLGLQNGIKKVYGLKKPPTKKQMETLSKKWMPYRTYAARVLWKSLELP